MNQPTIRELEESDIRSILARNAVGRLAFNWSGEVDIRPFHYVFADGRIYGRTSPGEKFELFDGGGGRVAFEVDEVESIFRWKSVIVRGPFHVLAPDGPDAEEWKNAVRLLRRIVKDGFTLDDPVPERRILFRIAIEQATGRECT